MEKVHLIGNAHLDPVWLWRWQEGYSEVLATFRSALDRISEFDGFIFTCAGAMYYQWVEETDPEMFEEIRRRVAEGRWVIVGGWMIQPDCNLPCGESFARHSLYGQSYFKEKFGVIARVGYNVDSFGHSAMLPQILKLSQMNAYVFMRPSENENNYPFKQRTFRWISPDGTEIPTFRIINPYCTKPFGEAAVRAKDAKQLSDAIGQPLMSFYGVGNHGGGPTIENVLSLLELQRGEDGAEYVFSSPNRFFEELDAESLPEYRGDLFHHAVGCYSAAMRVKSLNRISEARLINAEKADTAAVLLGLKASPESLKEAWRPTLFNHFHDIAGGCCIRSALEDAAAFFGSSIHGADRVQNRAVQAIAWNIDTSKGNPVVLNKADFKVWERDGAGTPIILFNMNSYPVKTPARLNCLVGAVEDADGNPVATQRVRAAYTDNGNKWESEIVAELPAMGWRLYWGYKDRENPDTAPDGPRFDGRHMENRWLSVDLSEDGFIETVYDRVNGRSLLTDKIVPVVLDEADCDTWAHGKFGFENVIGSFKDAEVLFYEEGALRQEIGIRYTYGRSELTVKLTLYRDLPELYFDCKLNWQEKNCMLKLRIPTVFTGGRDIAAVPFGFSTRHADGREQPMQKWVAVCEGDYGLGVATDTRSAYDLKDGLLRITAVRSPYFAEQVGQRDVHCENMELGEQSFRLALRPFCSDIPALYRLAENLLTAPTAILGTYHKGALAADGSMLEITADNIVAVAFKAAEDGNGYILRCHEISGKETETAIRVPALGIAFDCRFGPQEIKTFRLADSAVSETDFLEDI